MRRRAILIGDNEAVAIDPLRGVKRDLDSARRFLQSPTGGAWNDDEFWPLAKPRLTDLRAALDEARKSSDYLLVVAVGHGAFDGASYLNINDRETIEIVELAKLGPVAQRVAVISDACREFVAPPDDARLAGFDFDDVGAIPWTPAQIERRHVYRAAYERAIEKSAAGNVVLWACDKGQTADDVSSYTQALLRNARSMAKDERRPVGQLRTVLLSSVHLLARHDIITTSTRREQTPVMRSDRELCFPFAVT